MHQSAKSVGSRRGVRETISLQQPGDGKLAGEEFGKGESVGDAATEGGAVGQEDVDSALLRVDHPDGERSSSEHQFDFAVEVGGGFGGGDDFDGKLGGAEEVVIILRRLQPVISEKKRRVRPNWPDSRRACSRLLPGLARRPPPQP